MSAAVTNGNNRERSPRRNGPSPKSPPNSATIVKDPQSAKMSLTTTSSSSTVTSSSTTSSSTGSSSSSSTTKTQTASTSSSKIPDNIKLPPFRIPKIASALLSNNSSNQNAAATANAANNNSPNNSNSVSYTNVPITDKRRHTVMLELEKRFRLPSKHSIACEHGMWECTIESINKNQLLKDNKAQDLSLYRNNRELNKTEYKEYMFLYRRLAQFLRSNPTLIKKLNGADTSVTNSIPLSIDFSYSLPYWISRSEGTNSTDLDSIPESLLLLLDSQDLLKKTEQRKTLEKIIMNETQTINPLDAPNWSVAPEGDFECGKCGNGKDILLLITINSMRKEDMSDEPLYTLKCKKCGNLWRETNGETFAG